MPLGAADRRAANPRASARARAALGALAAALVAIGLGSTASSQSSTPVPVATIRGAGSWGPNFEITSWENALLGDGSGVDVRYTAHGSQLGRGELLSGSADFVFSGVPFTTDELKQLPGGKSDLIDVPLQVSSLAFLVASPFPNGFQAQTDKPSCDPDDPPPPDFTCSVRTPYTGALKIPPANLSAMLVNFAGTSSCSAPPAPNPDPHLPLNSWTCHSITDSFGLTYPVTWVGMSATAGPAPVLRSDPDETNYYLQQYVKTAAKTEVWDKLVAEGNQSDPPIAWDPITERFPRLTKVASRDGAGQQAQQLGFASQNPITGNFSNQTAGLIADIPASGAADVKLLNPNVVFAPVKNGGGEFVAPSTDSINKAVNAGGDTALYALDHAVAGAYPLAWIDHLYVNTKPTTALTAEKVEALAAMIRYIATDGQDEAAKVGEGQLSAPLKTQALAGADDLVSKACPTSTGATIVSNTDPSPAPKASGTNAIGTMKHCVAASTATTTTAATVAAAAVGNTSTPLGVASTPIGAASTSDTVPLTPLPASTPSTTPAAATATATDTATDPKASTKPHAETVVDLPMSADDPNTIDRLALGVLGAGAFLVLRAPMRRLFRPGPL
jgi:ABC-type phosphate transport system substrate-binding protein